MNNELNSATQAQAAMPEGWKLVPIEPTDEMVLAPGALRLTGNVARIHRNIYAAMLAAAPPSPQPVAESVALDALRAVCRLLDGGQPKDAAGALMVAQSALSGKPAAWLYDMTPPQGFLDYVRANYNGVIDIHAPDWHAKRLWNAAMRNAPAAALQPVAGLTDADIDLHLDRVLRAAGSALKHYSLPKSLDDLRAAMRHALTGQAGATGESK